MANQATTQDASIRSLMSLQDELQDLLNIKTEILRYQEEKEVEKIPIRIPLSEVAFLDGALVEPNKVVAHLGAGYFAEYEGRGGVRLIDRRVAAVREQLAVVRSATGLAGPAAPHGAPASSPPPPPAAAPLPRRAAAATAAAAAAAAVALSSAEATRSPLAPTAAVANEEILGSSESSKSENQSLRDTVADLTSRLQALELDNETRENENIALKAALKGLEKEKKRLEKEQLQSKKDQSAKPSNFGALMQDFSVVMEKYGYDLVSKPERQNMQMVIQTYREELSTAHERILELEQMNSKLQKELTLLGSGMPEMRESPQIEKEEEEPSPPPATGAPGGGAEAEEEEEEEEEEEAPPPTAARGGGGGGLLAPLPFVEIEEVYDAAGNLVSSSCVDLGREFDKNHVDLQEKKAAFEAALNSGETSGEKPNKCTAIEKSKAKVHNLIHGTSEKENIGVDSSLIEQDSPVQIQRSESEDMGVLEQLILKEAEAEQDDATAKKRGLVSKAWKTGFLTTKKKGKKSAKKKQSREESINGVSIVVEKEKAPTASASKHHGTCNNEMENNTTAVPTQSCNDVNQRGGSKTVTFGQTQIKEIPHRLDAAQEDVGKAQAISMGGQKEILQIQDKSDPLKAFSSEDIVERSFGTADSQTAEKKSYHPHSASSCSEKQETAPETKMKMSKFKARRMAARQHQQKAET